MMTSGIPDPVIDRQEIANLPYATIAAKIGKGQKTVLVLSDRQQNDLHWVSSDGGLLVIRNGRLVKTAGFDDNMRQTIFEDADPLKSGDTDLDGRRSLRVVDMDLDGRYLSVPISSTFEVMGPETIEIVGLQFETILVREHNRSQTINWSFDNLYWLDPYDGYVWKSQQHFTRNLPPVNIEVLKPAS